MVFCQYGYTDGICEELVSRRSLPLNPPTSAPFFNLWLNY